MALVTESVTKAKKIFNDIKSPFRNGRKFDNEELLIMIIPPPMAIKLIIITIIRVVKICHNFMSLSAAASVTKVKIVIRNQRPKPST